MPRSSAPPLRTVASNERAPKVAPQTVAEAAKRGTTRELLVSMRDRIADAVSGPNCPPRELASLTKRLQDIARDIETIDAREVSGDRLRELEKALALVAPDHPLLGSSVDDGFDASAI